MLGFFGRQGSLIARRSSRLQNQILFAARTETLALDLRRRDDQCIGRVATELG